MGIDAAGHAQEGDGYDQPFRNHLLVGSRHGGDLGHSQPGVRRLGQVVFWFLFRGFQGNSDYLSHHHAWSGRICNGRQRILVSMHEGLRSQRCSVLTDGHQMRCSIIQRAGIVPLSIAGIFKEVSTIAISSWVFGDQLTKLNVVGVLITVIGELFDVYR